MGAYLSTASRKVEKDHGVLRGSAADTADTEAMPAKPAASWASWARRPLEADISRAGMRTASTGRARATPPGWVAGAVSASAEAIIVGTA